METALKIPVPVTFRTVFYPLLDEVFLLALHLKRVLEKDGATILPVETTTSYNALCKRAIAAGVTLQGYYPLHDEANTLVADLLLGCWRLESAIVCTLTDHQILRSPGLVTPLEIAIRESLESSALALKNRIYVVFLREPQSMASAEDIQAAAQMSRDVSTMFPDCDTITAPFPEDEEQTIQSVFVACASFYHAFKRN